MSFAFDIKKLKKISKQQILLTDLTDTELARFCEIANEKYRSGNPIISDSDYDFVFLAELKKRLPKHKLLSFIEGDNSAFGDNKLLLPKPMLSTDKAYSISEINKWISRIHKFSNEIDFDISKITIKATAKLDGFAAFDDGKILYTRGDGKKGSDISRVFTRGLMIFNGGKRGLGAGEIVVKKSYFIKYLSDKFEHPRNFQASIIKEKQLNDIVKKSINDGAAIFVPFSLLPKWQGSIRKLLAEFENIVANSLLSVDFDVDGVIFEVENREMQLQMGANRKFHRWQMAFKENKEKAQVKILDIVPQVGRTGKITPVAKLTPTFLSGATIANVSCHNYGLVKQQKLGAGSIVELVRSGLVIPKINKVLKSTTAIIPTNCPNCESILIWDNDFLLCKNSKCSAQIIAKMEYFFASLGNNDGFGYATIHKIYNAKKYKVIDIYGLDKAALIDIGFGKKTSNNLILELKKSKTVAIEDWRFLAAFGIERLGFGNSELLLKHYDLIEIFELSVEKIIALNGFAELSANIVVTSLKNIKDEFYKLYKLGFNITKSKTINNIDGYFGGKKLVFSGTMLSARTEMQKQAKENGSIVQNSVNKSTDFLIIGDKVGQSKLQKAQSFGVEILSEAQYLQKII